jgi:hypothetical protein
MVTPTIASFGTVGMSPLGPSLHLHAHKRSVAFGGTADNDGRVGPAGPVAFDPTETSVAQGFCGARPSSALRLSVL